MYELLQHDVIYRSVEDIILFFGCHMDSKICWIRSCVIISSLFGITCNLSDITKRGYEIDKSLLKVRERERERERKKNA